MNLIVPPGQSSPFNFGNVHRGRSITATIAEMIINVR